jgi:hypothetical protein
LRLQHIFFSEWDPTKNDVPPSIFVSFHPFSSIYTFFPQLAEFINFYLPFNFSQKIAKMPPMGGDDDSEAVSFKQFDHNLGLKICQKCSLGLYYLKTVR